MAQAALLATAVYGAYAANESGKAQEGLARKNARLLDASAADEIARGEEEVLATKRRVRRTIGAQRAAAAGQGIDVNVGTAADLQAETGMMGAADEATIRRNAFRSAWGLGQQAANQRLSGQYARRAGRNQAVGTLLGGVGQASSYWDGSAPTVVGTNTGRGRPLVPSGGREY